MQDLIEVQHEVAAAASARPARRLEDVKDQDGDGMDPSIVHLRHRRLDLRPVDVRLQHPLGRNRIQPHLWPPPHSCISPSQSHQRLSFCCSPSTFSRCINSDGTERQQNDSLINGHHAWAASRTVEWMGWRETLWLLCVLEGDASAAAPCIGGRRFGCCSVYWRETLWLLLRVSEGDAVAAPCVGGRRCGCSMCWRETLWLLRVLAGEDCEWHLGHDFEELGVVSEVA